MDLDKIIEKLSNPEKLIDPAEINILQSYLNGHITALEEEAWERQLVASNKLAEINGFKINDIGEFSVINITSDKALSAAKAEVLWKVSNEYRLWIGVERIVKKLKRYRSDLKDRFSVLMGKQRY